MSLGNTVYKVYKLPVVEGEKIWLSVVPSVVLV